MSAQSGALEAVDRILNRGGEDEDVVREVAAVLHERLFAWVGIAVDDGPLFELGDRPGEPALRVPVAWRGERVGEISAEAPEADDGNRPLLDRVAVLISAHVEALRPPRHPT